MQLESNIVKNAKVSPSLLEHRLTDPIRGIAYPHHNEYDYLTGYIKNFCSSGT